jgi:Rad3-related DNA helicase
LQRWLQSTHRYFEEIDFIDMKDQLHSLKQQTTDLTDQQTNHHATLHDRIASLENAATWATQDEMDKSVKSNVETQLKHSWNSTEAQFQTLQTRISDEVNTLDAIAKQRETVIDELNTAFEVLRDELSKEVRENTMDELFDDLNQDTVLQGKIQRIIQKAHNPAQLQETMTSFLNDQIHQYTLLQRKIRSIIQKAHDPAQLQETITSFLNDQMDDIRTHIHSQVKDMTAAGLEIQLSELVATGIKEIDSVIKGTTDQAIEIIMTSTRLRSAHHEAPPTRSAHQEAPPTQAAPAYDPIPAVTPQRTTFRGRNV